MLFTGDLIDAREAERLDLVNHVYPAEEFEVRVRELTEKLAKGPAKAISLIKKAGERRTDHEYRGSGKDRNEG